MSRFVAIRARWLHGPALLLLVTACDRAVAPAPVLEIHPSIAVVRPGSKTPFYVIWSVGSHRTFWSHDGPGQLRSTGDSATFVSPYIVPMTTRAEIRASADLGSRRSVSARARAVVVIRQGSFPGAEDCVGLHQDHLPLLGEYVFVDELPEAITKVSPAYPDSARAAGVQGTVIVAALVCRSGRVLDTIMVQSIPLLDEAAMAAVVQWIFKPASKAGDPVAVWVHVPVRFSLHAPERIPTAQRVARVP